MTFSPHDSIHNGPSDSASHNTASANSHADSVVKEGIQTSGGLPEWLLNSTIEDLTSPVMKREAPGSRRVRSA